MEPASQAASDLDTQFEWTLFEEPSSLVDDAKASTLDDKKSPVHSLIRSREPRTPLTVPIKYSKRSTR